MDYVSCKPLADLAVGVIRGAAKHLGSPVDVSYAVTAGSTRFRVVRANDARLAA